MNFWHRAIAIFVLMMFAPAAVHAGNGPFGCGYSNNAHAESLVSVDADHARLIDEILPGGIRLLGEGTPPHKPHCHGRTPATVSQSVLRTENPKASAAGADEPTAAHAILLNIPKIRPYSRAAAIPLAWNLRGDAQLAEIATVVLLI